MLLPVLLLPRFLLPMLLLMTEIASISQIRHYLIARLFVVFRLVINNKPSVVPFIFIFRLVFVIGLIVVVCKHSIFPFFNVVNVMH